MASAFLTRARELGRHRPSAQLLVDDKHPRRSRGDGAGGGAAPKRSSVQVGALRKCHDKNKTEPSRTE